MNDRMKALLQDVRYYAGFLPEKAWLALKCEYARITKSATGMIDNCGTCRFCHAVRSIIKAAVFVGVAALSPILALVLLGLYFVMAE